MSVRTMALGSTAAALAVTFGFAIAYWVESESAAWIALSVGVGLALLIAAWTARSADSEHGWSRLGMLLLVLVVGAVLTVVLTFSFLTVECQTFDNCIFD